MLVSVDDFPTAKLLTETGIVQMCANLIRLKADGSDDVDCMRLEGFWILTNVVVG
jgi:hypothetical protein